MTETPQAEHQWLQKLVGDWTFETECVMGPDQPPDKFAGVESVRSVGEFWVQCEGKGDAPGCGSATNFMTLGYNPARKRYVGTFVSSMMTRLWVYDGELDPSGRVLTLDTEGPSFADMSKLTRYQDIIEIKSDDHRTLSSRFLGDDGQWHSFMTAHYRRVKQ